MTVYEYFRKVYSHLIALSGVTRQFLKPCALQVGMTLRYGLKAWRSCNVLSLLAMASHFRRKVRMPFLRCEIGIIEY